MLDDFHASMPNDMTNFERVNHLRPLTLPAEIAIYFEGDDRKFGGRDDGTGKFVRAKRDVLRHWLSSHIDVQYGKKAERIEESDDGVTVHFDDGTSARGDIAVGADGVHSMGMFISRQIKVHHNNERVLTDDIYLVRRHILGGKQNDPMRVHKTATINGITKLTGDNFAEQLSLGHSSYIVYFKRDKQQYMLFIGLDSVSEDGKTGSYYWDLIWPCEDGDRDDHWALNGKQKDLLAHTKEVIKKLKPEFRKVVEMTPEHLILVPGLRFHILLMEELPASRVTLLGDAARTYFPLCFFCDEKLRNKLLRRDAPVPRRRWVSGDRGCAETGSCNRVNGQE